MPDASRSQSLAQFPSARNTLYFLVCSVNSSPSFKIHIKYPLLFCSVFTPLFPLPLSFPSLIHCSLQRAPPPQDLASSSCGCLPTVSSSRGAPCPTHPRAWPSVSDAGYGAGGSTQQGLVLGFMESLSFLSSLEWEQKQHWMASVRTRLEMAVSLGHRRLSLCLGLLQ